MRVSVLLLLLLPSAAFAQLRATEAYALPAKVGQAAGVYLQLANQSAEAVTLVSVSTPVASIAQLQATVRQNGVMVTHPNITITIPAKSKVRLLPGGTSVQLINLTQPLLPVTEFPLTLQLASGKAVVLRVEVKHDATSDSSNSSY